MAALLHEAEAGGHTQPLSDHLLLDLHRGGSPGFLAVLVDGDAGLDAYGQVSAANESSSLEIVVHPSATDRASELTVTVVSTALDATDGPIYWWVFDAPPEADALAGKLGFTPERTLLQMRRPLPTGMDPGVDTRPFVVGVDEEAWLRVNNRAFADHPEQGGWDLATLRAREAEPWFDPAGFLLHERDDRLAAFCWTKLHNAPDPAGEIYVIAVDPDFAGLGLGKAMTLAGLDSIAARGVTTGMLYVDGGNHVAHSMYAKLGFTVARTDVAYRAR